MAPNNVQYTKQQEESGERGLDESVRRTVFESSLPSVMVKYGLLGIVVWIHNINNCVHCSGL